jgi:hypothetical protein
MTAVPFASGTVSYTTLSGPLYPTLVPLLRGKLSVEEIIVQLSGKAAPHEVLYTIEYLRRRGLLVDASHAGKIWRGGARPARAGRTLRRCHL